MKSTLLINILYRTFQVLYYGQYAIYILLLPLLWLSVKVFSPFKEFDQYDFPEKGPKVVYDTLAQNQSGEKAGTSYVEDTLMNYEKLTERDTIYTTNAVGKVTHKRVKDPKDPWRLHREMTQERDSARKHVEQLRQQSYRLAVDSIVRNHPEQYVVVRKNGYVTTSKNFNFQANFVLRGDIRPTFENPSSVWRPDWKDPSKNWFYTLIKHPRTQLSNQPASGPLYNLSFSFVSWQEVQNVPWYILLAWSLSFCVYLLFLPITYQFMKLFQTMRQKQIFSSVQVRRLVWIGRLFCGYACLNFIVSEVRDQTHHLIPRHHSNPTLRRPSAEIMPSGLRVIFLRNSARRNRNADQSSLTAT